MVFIVFLDVPRGYNKQTNFWASLCQDGTDEQVGRNNLIHYVILMSINFSHNCRCINKLIDIQANILTDAKNKDCYQDEVICLTLEMMQKLKLDFSE